MFVVAQVTVAGIAVGVVGAVVLLFLAFVGIEAWDTRRSESRADGYYGGRIRPTRGTVICDWVDAEVLASIARQNDIEPAPSRLERGTTTTAKAGLHGGKRLGGMLGRERSRSETSVYEVTSDPDGLLVKVLGELHDRGALDDDVDMAWGGGPFTDDTLDQFIHAAQSTEKLDTARAALKELQAESTREQKTADWASRGTRPPQFVLIESTWRIDRPAGGTRSAVTLDLRKLRRRPNWGGDPIHGNPPEVDETDMPSGMGVIVPLAGDKLTDAGKARVTGTELRAGVFGMTASFSPEDGRLSVTPVAVFSRVAE